MRPLRYRRLTALAFALPLGFAGAAFAQSVITSETTVTTLTSSANPAKADGSITLTASVVTTGGTGVPGGSIQFRDLSTMKVLGWTPVDKPSITVSQLASGRHEIRAEYTGTDSFLPLILQPSQSEPLLQSVQVTPQLKLSASPNPSAPGQVVTLTAVVSSKAGKPRGAVSFSDGGAVIAAHVTLDSSGTASFTTSALADGARTLVVTYEGDDAHAAATSKPLFQDVNAEHALLLRSGM
jgi:hypothetical protein